MAINYNEIVSYLDVNDLLFGIGDTTYDLTDGATFINSAGLTQQELNDYIDIILTRIGYMQDYRLLCYNRFKALEESIAYGSVNDLNEYNFYKRKFDLATDPLLFAKRLGVRSGSQVLDSSYGVVGADLTTLAEAGVWDDNSFLFVGGVYLEAVIPSLSGIVSSAEANNKERLGLRNDTDKIEDLFDLYSFNINSITGLSIGENQIQLDDSSARLFANATFFTNDATNLITSGNFVCDSGLENFYRINVNFDLQDTSLVSDIRTITTVLKVNNTDHIEKSFNLMIGDVVNNTFEGLSSEFIAPLSENDVLSLYVDLEQITGSGTLTLDLVSGFVTIESVKL